jgi:hypothetical protein
MTTGTYVEGYQAGWASYLEGYKNINDSLEKLIARARLLAEKARQALTPQQQGDYWLGYHHGRAAARTCIAKTLS